MKVLSSAEAKVHIIRDIKDNSVDGYEVDSALSTYAKSAGLDLTEYNLLGNSKMTVCNKFLRANYETKGWKQFVEDFKAAVKDAKNPDPTTGGSTGGGGGGGGIVAPPVVVPSKPMEDNTVVDTKIPEIKGFNDMTDHKWAEEAVNALFEKGIISGIGNSNFNPEGKITREQFAKMVVLALNAYKGDAKTTLKDVNSEDWSYTYIASAVQAGLIMGNDNNEFKGTETITRQDIAVILYRAMQKKEVKLDNAKDSFNDIDYISDYAKDAVKYMAGEGIINGFEDGSFRPTEPATRAQAAKLIYALIGGDE